jgi:hypothetical protein
MNFTTDSKTTDNTPVIEQFSGDNIPTRYLNKFQSFVAYVLVIPTTFADDMLTLLVKNNYVYTALPIKNGFLVGIRYQKAM